MTQSLSMSWLSSLFFNGNIFVIYNNTISLIINAINVLNSGTSGFAFLILVPFSINDLFLVKYQSYKLSKLYDFSYVCSVTDKKGSKIVVS